MGTRPRWSSRRSGRRIGRQEIGERGQESALVGIEHADFLGNRVPDGHPGTIRGVGLEPVPGGRKAFFEDCTLVIVEGRALLIGHPGPDVGSGHLGEKRQVGEVRAECRGLRGHVGAGVP